MEGIEAGEVEAEPVTGTAPALVAFVRSIGLQAGDVQRLTLTGPDDRTLADSRSEPLDRHKSQVMVFAGIRRPQPGWRPGVYRARYTVERAGKTAIEHSFTLDLKP
jgi:hypothetical protein